MQELTESDNAIINLEDDQPIAVRRKRRISTSSSVNALPDPQIKRESNGARTVGIATPPTTPHRSKKRVRFSEPGLSTTGLTPFFRQSLLSSPPPSRSRRQATPSSSRWNLAVDDTPIITGTLQFAPFRQVLEGRVKRRIRRHRLSEELNVIETEEKYERKSRKEEIELLKEELRQKNQEIIDMRDTQDLANQIDTEAGIQSLDMAHLNNKLKDLEHQVTDLQVELQRRESVAPEQEGPNLPAFVHDLLGDDDDFMQDFDDDFNGGTDLFLSTPARRSFPSPPMSMPNTPSKPASLGDANEALENERKAFELQMQTLQEELKTLSKTLELTNTTHERLVAKLSPYLSASNCSGESESLDAALDTVLTQLALSQSTALDNTTRYSALSNELKRLFPSSSGTAVNPDIILETLHNQFRVARLELEYLTPGENVEGFENSKLLDMLVSRLRILTKRVAQQDVDIDQYHSQEVSLRQQLGSRVDAMNSLQDSLSHAQSEAARLESDLSERDDSISKLTNALQGYRDEVTGLETLINRLEVEHAADLAILRDEVDSTKQDAESKILDEQLKRDTLEAAAEGREMLMLELEKRLSTALSSSQSLKAKLAAAQHHKASAVAQLQESASERERHHGEALALRDARVSELREEVERINGSLKEAHESIMELKREKRELLALLEGDWMRARNAIDNMGGHLAVPQQSRHGDANDEVAVTESSPLNGDEDGNTTLGSKQLAAKTVVRPGGLLFNASMARRRPSKKRRRYDSGLGFVDEGEEETCVDME